MSNNEMLPTTEAHPDSSLSSRDGAVKKPPSARNMSPAVPKEEALDVPQFDWNREMSACCGVMSFVHQIVWTATMGSLLFGINLSLLNTSLNHISWEYEWCDWKNGEDEVNGCSRHTIYSSFIMCAVFIGAAVGSMSGGAFLSYGRRGMILMSNVAFVVGITASLCANSFSALFFARLLVGLAVGLVSFCTPTYISEVSPTAKRGQYGVFHQLLIGIGVCIGVVLGLPIAFGSKIPEGEGPGLEEIPVFAKVWWRVMLGLGLIPVLLSAYLYGRVFTFETPTHYVECGQVADARMLLKRIYGKEDVEAELSEIKLQISQAQKAKDDGISLSVAWKDKDYRFVIVFGAIVSAFQQLSGVNVFVANSNALYIDAGLPNEYATVASVIQSVFGFLVTFPSIYLIDRVGRRSLFLWGTIAQLCCVLPATICYWVIEDKQATVTTWFAIVAALGTIIFFGIGYGPILWVWLFEIYPPEIKGVAGGLATAANWIAGIVMVFVTSYMNNEVAYLLFTIMLILALFLIIFTIRETKGRELGDSPYIKRAPVVENIVV